MSVLVAPRANGTSANTSTGIVVENMVLDCTEFKVKHPGGKGIIEGFAGSDCSWQVSEKIL